MPTLRRFFAIYTDGAGLPELGRAPPGMAVEVSELVPLVAPGPQDELFGPAAGAFGRFTPRRGFLVSLQREVPGPAGAFFDQTRAVLLPALHGVGGVGLDVLRLFPFTLALAEELLPEEHLAEDLYSVAFSAMGEHGVRAETLGLAHLDQPELTFTFDSPELREEAVLMCGHLVDWLLEHGRRVGPRDSLAFGLDRLEFGEGRLTRGWHHPLITRLLPEARFPGVGVLEVRAGPGLEPAQPSLGGSLRRSLEQRQLLEEHDLTGDAPHATSTVQVAGEPGALAGLEAWREEPRGAGDSGWRVRAAGATAREERLTVAELARRQPSLVPYLALPWGARVTWSKDGSAPRVDASKVPGALDRDGEDA